MLINEFVHRQEVALLAARIAQALNRTDLVPAIDTQVSASIGVALFPEHGRDMSTVLNIPALTHMLFQGMFFIITPALICGAFAERMKFSTMVRVHASCGARWSIARCAIGCGTAASWPTASSTAGKCFAGGALDFAGGTVVHISSGVSALVCALVIGKRLGFGNEPMPPHNLTYTVLGAGHAVGGLVRIQRRQRAGCRRPRRQRLRGHALRRRGRRAGLGRSMEWITRGKPSVLGAASGAVAGLVCITPAAGFVQPMPAIVMGAGRGRRLLPGLHEAEDDARLRRFAGRLWRPRRRRYAGRPLTGVFATRAVWDIGGGKKLGLLEGERRADRQVIATGGTWVFAVVVTFILLKVLDADDGPAGHAKPGECKAWTSASTAKKATFFVEAERLFASRRERWIPPSRMRPVSLGGGFRAGIRAGSFSAALP